METKETKEVGSTYGRKLPNFEEIIWCVRMTSSD